MPEPASIEMSTIQRHLAELVDLAMASTRQMTSDRLMQLQAIQMTVRVLVDVVQCLEVRDLAEAQRQLERAIALNQQRREPWE